MNRSEWAEMIGAISAAIAALWTGVFAAGRWWTSQVRRDLALEKARRTIQKQDVEIAMLYEIIDELANTPEERERVLSSLMARRARRSLRPSDDQ